MLITPRSLSWADTAASTFGRLWGRYTPPLPRSLLGLPLAPRKSLAGFAAAAITGAAITAGFWAVLAPMYDSIAACWSVEEGVRAFGVDHSAVGDAARAFLREQGVPSLHSGGWVGLAIISVIAGLCTAVAEALGEFSVLVMFGRVFLELTDDPSSVRSRLVG